ncbi:MAG: DRTGG domain-containing protein [Cellulosilyticaceae bacterium]
MKVAELVEILELKVLAGNTGLEKEFEGAYIGDLLSFVMAHAKERNVWFTIQGHLNSVAVASLLGLGAIVITEGVEPTTDMLAKAEEEEIPVLFSVKNSFELALQWAKLIERG